MSLMGKPPPPLPISELCQGWETPSTSWIDYFLRPVDLTSLLRHPEQNQEIIAGLTMQYVEQTIALDKDLTSLRKRTLALTEPSERNEMETDVQYLQYKKCLTWLCAMACFSAIEWRFEKLIDGKKQNAHLVRYLIEKTSEYISLSKKEPLVNFAELLCARFRLYINRKLRIPPPAGKPQTNNPSTQEDKGIIIAANHRKAIFEIKEHCKEAAAELEKMIIESKSRRVEIPLVETFLSPFLQSREQYLSIALIGRDLTLDGMPAPDFDLVNIQAPEVELLNILRYELACYNFQLLKFDDARKYFGDLISSLPAQLETIGLCSIDREELNGYLVAVELPQLKTATETTTMDTDDRVVTDDSSLTRRFWMTREYAMLQMPLAKAVIAKIENLARETVDGAPLFPSSAFRDLHQPQLILYFEALTRLLKRYPDRAHIKAQLFYLSALVPKFYETAMKKSFNIAPLRDLITVTLEADLPRPSSSPLSNFYTPEDPYWRLITSFDVSVITGAFQQLTSSQDVNQLVIPYLFKYPENLSEVILSQQHYSKLNDFFLAKLEQLSSLNDLHQWKEYLNAIATQVPIMNQVADRVFMEAIMVQTRTMNRLLRYAHCTLEEDSIREQIKLVENYLLMRNPKLKGDLLIECVAFLLNVGRGDFVLSSIPQDSLTTIPYMMLAKMLAAWVQVLEKPFEMRQEFSTSFAHYIDQNGIFLSSNNGREVERQRGDLLSFIKLLTEQEQLSLLISHLCHLYNRHLLTTQRPALALEFQYKELWKNDLEMPNGNEGFIDEALSAALVAGLRLNPMNAFWLRSLADYQYTKGMTEKALKLYIETLCACTDNQLTPPFPEALLNDLMWYRMRVCLTSSGCHTLAALVAQLIGISNYRLDQYAIAANNICSQHVLDACDALTYLCFDHRLTETLTEAFEQIGMQNKTDTFVEAAAHPALNASNPAEIVTFEKSRRVTALLRSLAAIVFSIHT